MKPLEWAKHAAVFVAALFVVRLGFVLSPYFIAPDTMGTMTPGGLLAAMGVPTLDGLIAAWPICIALAICQALTFHYVKRWATPIYLSGLFVAALLFAMRYASVATAG